MSCFFGGDGLDAPPLVPLDTLAVLCAFSAIAKYRYLSEGGETEELSPVNLFTVMIATSEHNFFLCRVPLSLAVSFCLVPATKSRAV